MNKYEVRIGGAVACHIAEKNKRATLERVAASQAQRVGAIWEQISKFPAGLPVTVINKGRI